MQNRKVARIEDIFKKRKASRSKKGIDRSQGSAPYSSNSSRSSSSGYTKLSIKTNNTSVRSTFI